MKVKQLAISKIERSKYNPRVELLPADPEYQQIEASLDEFGQVDPLIWNEHNGVLVGGHQRLNILEAKGRKQVYVSVVNIADEDREKALNVALNQGGRWDPVKLAAVLPPIEAAGLMQASGLDAEVIERMRAAMERGDAIDSIRNAMGDADRPPAPPGVGNVEVTGLREVTYAFTADQHRTIQDAIATAKEQWGATTSMDALAQICAHFNDEAKVG